MTAPKTDLKASIKNRIKQAKAKKAVWLCSCGYKIPKKSAALSVIPPTDRASMYIAPYAAK